MTTIPLNHLTPAKANVRKNGAHDGIEELAASIAAHGLLTSLTVRKSGRGKYAVIAGQRRYRALCQLAEQDKIPFDHPVLCHVVERDADATEIGLAENVVRLAMHPADQFEAFRTLVDKGADTASIAARFGVAETVVAKRLKLGRVSPAILDAYRAGALGLEQVQAFTVSDDREAQERVWAACNGHRANPVSIRRALTENEIPSSDRRVCFVGLAAYEEAGGNVRRDLFDDEGGGYLQDAAVLDRLVEEKLEALADTVRAEGWSWVELRPEFGYGERGQYRRCTPEQTPLPEAEAAELEALQAEHDELLESLYDEDGEEDAVASTRLESIEERMGVLTDQAAVWTPGLLASAGAVIHLSDDGDAVVERGLMRRGDAVEDTATGEEVDHSDAPSPAPSLPATLIADLTAQRTAALRAALAQQPDVALAAVTHALARGAFYSGGGETCLGIVVKKRSLTPHLTRPGECSGSFAFDAECGKWIDRLPGDADCLWDWCLLQTQDTLLDLLAVSAAASLDAVCDKKMPAGAPQLLHADALAKALQFDMHAWFMPTAESYFGRVSRGFIVEALTEAGRPLRTRAWSKLKKTELAAFAERDIAGTGWLPQPLRTQAGRVQPDAEQPDMPVAMAA